MSHLGDECPAGVGGRRPEGVFSFDNPRLLRYTILMPLNRGIDAIIQEAIERGEFDNLPGAGKPLDLTAYFDTPEEVRLANSILKNANILPQGAELLKEIAALEEQLTAHTSQEENSKIRKMIQDRLLKYRLLVERKR